MNQHREPLEATGMKLIHQAGAVAVLQDKDRLEVWRENDNYSGYVVEIDGKGYEFVYSVRIEKEA